METISLPFASFVFQTLGLPGLIFIVWWFDHTSQIKQREQDKVDHAREREEYAKARLAHETEIGRILTQYREDVSAVRRLYENNVHLVADYEKMAKEQVDTIRLNTEAQTSLLMWLKQRTPCADHMKHLVKP